MSYENVGSWNRAIYDCPDGWRLPTSEELKCMCTQKKTKKNNSALELFGYQYWTSTEIRTEPHRVITRTINDCKAETEDKFNLFYIRYVR